MRIQFVISGLGLGGAEGQVVLLSKEIARRGHAVCIYALNRITPRASALQGSGVDLVVDQKSMALDVSVLWRLRRHLAAWQPDVVHGFLYDGNLYARLAGVGLGIPVLDSERNDNYRISNTQSIGYRLTAGLSSGVVANSYAGAEFARCLHRTRAEHTHVVWNGIDLAEIDERLAHGRRAAIDLVPGSGFKRVCIVGNIKPQKDYLLALRVVRRLVDADPCWRVLCVGEERVDSPGYMVNVLAERDRLGLQDHVFFTGGRRDVPEIVASCEALLVTSAHEGFPNVVLEAMACGTPVASTDYSDVNRILPMPWQVVASRDEGELAAALMRCDAEARAVAVAQRRWVETHATAAVSADSLLSVYRAYASAGVAAREQTS